MKTYQTPEVLLRNVEPVDIVTTSFVAGQGTTDNTVLAWEEIL